MKGDRFIDIVEEVKGASPIEDVMEACGISFQRRTGKYWHAREHDSLVVDVHKQAFWWNSKGADWSGDVIRWVEKWRNCEFRAAVEWLAERAKIQVRWEKVDEGVLRGARLREDAFEVACRVWQKWLMADEAAYGYARGRGWTEAVIQESGIGFTGRRTEGEYKEMRGELSMYGVEADGPAAVAVLGWRGDVIRWGIEHEVDVKGESWVEWGMIPGAMGKMRLVYPHWVNGRVRYFSTRRILGDREWAPSTADEDGKSLDHEPHEIHEKNGKEIKKSWNPPVKLGGERVVFLNQCWRREAEVCVVVEGPADAISLGQWGYASLALCGVGGSEDGMEKVRKLVEKCQAVYVCLDADAAGKENARKVAERLGPMVRLVRLESL